MKTAQEGCICCWKSGIQNGPNWPITKQVWQANKNASLSLSLRSLWSPCLSRISLFFLVIVVVVVVVIVIIAMMFMLSKDHLQWGIAELSRLVSLLLCSSSSSFSWSPSLQRNYNPFRRPRRNRRHGDCYFIEYGLL